MLVTVGLPVYNGQNYLEQAAASILSQDFPDFELLISDNASTDATRDICEQLVRQDTRVRYTRLPSNIGAARNYNALFDQARGKYFKWQAHDDLCRPGFLRACVEVLEGADNTTVLAYPQARIVDAQGAELPGFFPENLQALEDRADKRLALILRRLNMACPVFGLIRTDTLRSTRRIGSFLASDYVLLAELSMLGRIREIPEVLFERRIHPGISTYANRNPRELQRWFDPSRPLRWQPFPPMLALGTEFLRSTRLLPLSAADRLRCQATILHVWYGRELRNLGGRYKQQLRAARTTRGV